MYYKWCKSGGTVRLKPFILSCSWIVYFQSQGNGVVETRAIYNILGVDIEGRKDVFGLYTAENEGAKFWLSLLTDLETRGVEDMLIACIDGLKGFPEAVEAIFPKTRVRLCIVHQIRSSMRYVPEKGKKAVMDDMKPIYQANNEQQGTKGYWSLKKYGARNIR